MLAGQKRRRHESLGPDGDAEETCRKQQPGKNDAAGKGTRSSTPHKRAKVPRTTTTTQPPSPPPEVCVVGIDIGARRLGIAVVVGADKALQSTTCRVAYAEVVDLETDATSEVLLAKQLRHMVESRRSILLHPRIDAYAIEKQAVRFGDKGGNARMQVIVGILCCLFSEGAAANAAQRQVHGYSPAIVHCQSAAALQWCYAPPPSYQLVDTPQRKAWREWKQNARLVVKARSAERQRQKQQQSAFVSDTMTAPDPTQPPLAPLPSDRMANKMHELNKRNHLMAVREYLQQQADLSLREYFDAFRGNAAERDLADAMLNAMSAIQCGLSTFRKHAEESELRNRREKIDTTHSIGTANSGFAYAFRQDILPNFQRNVTPQGVSENVV